MITGIQNGIVHVASTNVMMALKKTLGRYFDARKRGDSNMLLDDITRSIQRYFETNFHLYPIERCPICGKIPEVKYYKNYDVFDISCRPLLSRTSHFYLFGSSGESKKSVVERWNDKVIEYESFNKTNPAESVLRRFV